MQVVARTTTDRGWCWFIWARARSSRRSWNPDPTTRSCYPVASRQVCCNWLWTPRWRSLSSWVGFAPRNCTSLMGMWSKDTFGSPGTRACYPSRICRSQGCSFGWRRWWDGLGGRDCIWGWTKRRRCVCSPHRTSRTWICHWCRWWAHSAWYQTCAFDTA